MHSGALTLINPTWMSRIRMLNSTHTNSIHVILRQNSPCFFLFTAVFIWHASSAFLNRYKPFQIYHTRDIFGNSFHIPQRRSFPTIFFFSTVIHIFHDNIPESVQTDFTSSTFFNWLKPFQFQIVLLIRAISRTAFSQSKNVLFFFHGIPHFSRQDRKFNY